MRLPVPADYVPRVREVMGPARRLYEWWPADQIGKALSLTQAFWLRHLPSDRHVCPGVIQRGLARRGLWAPAGLTDAGRDLQRTLGTIPEDMLRDRWRKLPEAMQRRYPRVDSVSLGPLEEPVTCTVCDRERPAELIAWDLYSWTSDLGVSVPCLACARKDQP